MPTLDQELDEFLAELPEGFTYGLRERLAFRQLLEKLLASGEIPETAASLKTLLAPLVCSTREQQDEFYQLFERRWSTQSPQGFQPPRERELPPRKRSRAPWIVLVALVTCGLLLLGVYVIKYIRTPLETIDLRWSPPSSEDLVPRVSIFAGRVSDANGLPIKGAEVWIPGQHQLTTADGTFRLFYTGIQKQISYLAAHPDYRSAVGFAEPKVESAVDESWKVIRSGTTSHLSSIFATEDGMKEWVVGAKGTILYSTDTEHWIIQASGTQNDLFWIYGTSDGRSLWAVGDKGTILHSSNGEHWTAQTNSTTSSLTSIYGTSDGRSLWAVGDKGTILHSSDGEHWTTQTSGTADFLYAIYGTSDGRSLWAVGSNGTILHSFDGEHWSAQTSGTTNVLRSIYGTSDGTSLWAVGTQGMILHSPDGEHWTAQTSGTTKDLYRIFGTNDDSRIQVVGAQGSILEASSNIKGSTSNQTVGTEVILSPLVAPSRPPVRTLHIGTAGTSIMVRDPVSAAFSRDGQFCAIAGRNSKIRIFSLPSWTEVSQINTAASLLTLSPDGKYLAASGSAGTFVFRGPWGTSIQPPAKVFPDALTSMTFSQDSRSLITFGADGMLRVFDAVTDQLEISTKGIEAIQALSSGSDDSTPILGVGQSWLWQLTWNSSAKILSQRQLIRIAPGMPIRGVQFDSTSGYWVVRLRGGPLDVWDGYGQRAQWASERPSNILGFGLITSKTKKLEAITSALQGRQSRSSAVEPPDSNSNRAEILRIVTWNRKTADLVSPLRWVAALLPIVAVMAWLWWLFRKRARLNRLTLSRTLTTYAFSPPTAAPPFRGQQAHALGRSMRRRRHVPSPELAIVATVNATAKSAGFFTPVFDIRTRQREFVILIGEAAPGDQQTRLYESLAEALGERGHGAFIELYVFRGLPAMIRDHKSDDWIDLYQVAARHPDHDLWIIADPAQFVDSFSLTLPDWLRELSRWREYVLLSPVDVDERTTALFESEKISFAPASLDGMTAFLAASDAELEEFRLQPQRFPRQLRQMPLRWVDGSSPGDRSVNDVLKSLREYLEPHGMLLAAACSVYPETLWGLTLWLAEKLIQADSQGQTRKREEILIRVTSLPWFRYGRIPDWMRAHLVNSLSDSDEARVRELIDEYLTNAKHGEGELTVARDRGDERKIRDYVMFSFLLGRRVNPKLAVKPPSLWLRMLFEGGRYVFGPRFWVHVAAGLLFGVITWFTSNLLWMRIPTRLEIAEWQLPEPAHATENKKVRTFPEGTMRRAILEVADSMVGQPSKASLETDVVRQASMFANDMSGTQNLTKEQRPFPGAAFNSGFIESVSGLNAVVIAVKDGLIQRFEESVPAGPFRDYSALVQSKATPSTIACKDGPYHDTEGREWDFAFKGNEIQMKSGLESCSFHPAGNAWKSVSMCPGAQSSNPGDQDLTLKADCNIAFEGYALTPGSIYGASSTQPKPAPTALADHGQVASQSQAPLGPSSDTPRIQEPLTLSGHTAAVWSVAWSPDGMRLATGSQDHTVKVWDAATGRELLTLRGHTFDVKSVAWNPDDRRLASASLFETAKVWDADTGKELLTLSDKAGGFLCVAWSPDGKRLATGDGDRTVKVWDAATGRELITLSGHSDLVGSVAWSPDGKRLATGSQDHTAKVWDAGTGEELLSLSGHTAGVFSVAWSPDSMRLATGSMDNTAKVWDAATGRELLILAAESKTLDSNGYNWTEAVAWSPDGKQLATGRLRDTKVWDAATGRELLTLTGRSITSVAWSPNGKRLATGSADNTVHVYTLDIRDMAARQVTQ